LHQTGGEARPRSLLAPAGKQPELPLRVGQVLGAGLADKGLLFEAYEAVAGNLEVHLHRKHVVRLDQHVGTLAVAFPSRTERGAAVVGDLADRVPERKRRLWKSVLDHRGSRRRIDLVPGLARPQGSHSRVERGTCRLKSLANGLGRLGLAVAQPVPGALQ